MLGGAPHPHAVYESKVDTADIERYHDVSTHADNRAARVELHISYHLTASQRKYIESQYPSYLIKYIGPLHSAQHPVLNTSRLCDEHSQYDLLMALFRPESIHDVGGNPRRARGIVRTHCSNPVLDQADLIRDISRPIPANTTKCAHRAQECDCGPFDVAVATHVLYYLTPYDVYSIVERTNKKVLLASVHNVFAGYGVLGKDGWYMNDGETVEFFANNACYSYKHPSVNWLRSGGMHIGDNTLAWTFVFGNEISVVVQFTIREGRYPLSQIPTVPLPTNAHTAGLVAMGVTKLMQLGAHYLGISGGRKFVVPSQVYHRVSTWAALRPRTADLLFQLSGEVRRAFKDCDLPDTILSDAVAPTVALVYCNLQASMDSLTTIQAQADDIEAYNAFLREALTPTSMVRPFAVVGAAFSVWLVARRLGFTRLRTLAACCAIAAFLRAVYKTGNALYLKAIAYRAASFLLVRYSASHGHVSAADFSEQHARCLISPSVTRVRLIDGVPRLRTFPPALTMSQIEAIPIDPRMNLLVREWAPDKRVEYPLCAYGIVNSMVVMPSCYDNSAESKLAMLRNRICTPAFSTKPAYDPVLVSVWWYYHRENERVMFGRDGAGTPFNLADWIAKYPANAQVPIHLAVWSTLFGEPASMYYYGLFMKRELYTKITMEGFTGTKPRAIQPCKYELQTTLVPKVMGFARHLKEWLHPKHFKPWCIPSGSTPAQMGAYHYHDRSEEHTWNEDDDSNFDVHQHEPAQTMAHDTMHRVVPGDSIRPHWERSGPTRAYFRGEARLDAPGYWMMHSGRIDTYITNTTINVSRSTFVMALWHHRHACIFCERPHSAFPYCPPCGQAFQVWWQTARERYSPDPLVQREDMKVQPLEDLVFVEAEEIVRPKLLDAQTVMEVSDAMGQFSGDDSLKRGKDMPTMSFRRLMVNKLGSDVKCKDLVGPTAIYQASFCSGLVWPSTVGPVLGPKLERWVVRSGYYMDPPSFQERLLRRQLRGDALGRYPQCRMVPFLREYWARILELTEGVVPAYKADKRYLDWIPNDLPADPNDETWVMMNAVYGLTRSQLVEYSNLLQSIHTLPAELNFAPFAPILLKCVDDDTESPLF